MALEGLKQFFLTIFHNLKTSSKSRLRLFLGIIGIAFVLVFIGVQVIRMFVSIGNPKWAVQYTRPGDGWSWYPQIAICPGVFDNVTADGQHDSFKVGTISRINCSFVEMTRDPNTGKIDRTYWPVPMRQRSYTVFDRSYDCYNANYDWNETPGVTFQNRDNHLVCSFKSNTNLRISYFRHPEAAGLTEEQKPSTRFDDWNNVGFSANTALSLRVSNYFGVNGRFSFGPLYAVWQNLVVFRYSFNDKDAQGFFSTYMSTSRIENNVEYYDLDFFAAVIAIFVIAVFTKQAYNVLVECIGVRFALKEATPLFAKSEEEQEQQDNQNL